MEITQPFDIIHITDVHNGVRSITAQQIQEGIKVTILEDPLCSKAKALAITGDFYDSKLDHNSDDAIVTTETIAMILRWCKLNNIVCLLLRGTPSHDARQTRWFDYVNEAHGISAKLYHFDTLDIKYVPELNMHVLGVPDEIAKPRVKADAMVKALLQERNLTKVGLTLTHGYYDFHLPKHEVEEGHSREFFESITETIVLNGHVHTGTLVGRILTGGSFGRYNHGEEEAKGAWRVTINTDKSFTANFLKNKVLTEFITLDVRGKKEEQVIKQVDRTVKHWETGHCRLFYGRKDRTGNLLGFFTEKYPNVIFTTKVEDSEETRLLQGESLDTRIRGTELNATNFPPMALDYIKARCGNESEFAAVKEVFEELLT